VDPRSATRHFQPLPSGAYAGKDVTDTALCS
jgi:hypothetical protein